MEEPLPKAEQRDAYIPPNENLLHCFVPIRALCVDILQNRSMPLSQRMLYLGIVLQRLQNTDWASLDPDEWVDSQLDQMASVPVSVEAPGNRDMYLGQNITVLEQITGNYIGLLTFSKRWKSDGKPCLPQTKTAYSIRRQMIPLCIPRPHTGMRWQNSKRLFQRTKP